MNEENKKTGFIKLFRSFVNWEWFDDVNTCHLFLYCLLRANITAGSWHGIDYKEGEFITSLQNLSISTGLTIQQVRTSLKKLKLTQSLTSKTTHRNTVITINNWNSYQQSNTINNNKITSNQHQNNIKITTGKEIKNIRNKEINTTTTENENLKFYGSYKNVGLTLADYRRLQTLTQSTERLNKLIDELDVAIETQKEKPYSAGFIHSHYERLKAFYEYKLKHPTGSGATNAVRTTRYKTAEERKEEKLQEILGRMNNESG